MASIIPIIKPNLLTTFSVAILLCFNVVAQTTPIPDVSFEQALIDYNIDTNGLNGNILNTDAESVITLNIFSKNITDLSGIEAFVNLKYLYSYYNNIANLDLQYNLELEVLDIENNSLTDLNVSQNLNLKELYVSNNQLDVLDVSNNLDLVVLSCNLNNICELDVTNNIDLAVLWCYSNILTDLNLEENILLESLFCGDNDLDSLDISNNTLLETISCGQNNITSFTVDNCLDLTYLDVSGNMLNELDITSNTSMRRLLCNNNSIQELDLSHAPELLLFYASFNNLRDIDLTNNNELKYVRLASNELESIDFRNGNNSDISDFNTLNNPALTCIYVDDSSASFLSDWDIDSSSNFVTDESACNALSVTDTLEEIMTFEIYPNPVVDYLNIKTIESKSKLVVYDTNGKTLLNKELITGLNSIDLSNYSSGMYLFKISSVNQTISKKIIIQ
ncbi:T9SS type A sorting domain-containing protein [Hanstruepera ponticola]|uniref:T9SS type A sorting domain-containing protein n=1 Tax=Hanstruepera ponticola TaxID=2042995 RepID=UPI0013C48103|nr:T9SS type A sorting domain-containing protein [Hanstruepera ponticola]